VCLGRLAWTRGGLPARRQRRRTRAAGDDDEPERGDSWIYSLALIFPAGTFYDHGELVFRDVYDTTKTIIVSLEHERYKKLIVEVNDPEAAARTLNAACGR
jgi:hypothetical protein